MAQNDLPAGMSDAERQAWYDNSHVLNGVRMGPAAIIRVEVEAERAPVREFLFDILRWALIGAVLTAVFGGLLTWFGG